jgi:hypothetical protein
LVKFGKITQFDADATLGRYYDYPPCCIAYFIKLRRHGISPGKFTRKFIFDYKTPIPGYIPCPKCILKGSIMPDKCLCKKCLHLWTYQFSIGNEKQHIINRCLLDCKGSDMTQYNGVVTMCNKFVEK